MNYSALQPQREAAEETRRQNALTLLLFLLIATVFLLRFAVSPQLMDLVVDYNSEEGSFYEKLHFGTYGILLLLPFPWMLRPVFLSPEEAQKVRALVYFTGGVVLLIAVMAVLRRTGASGYFIDTYVIAGAAGLLMYTVPQAGRRALGNVVLGLLLASALLGIVEAATTTRILPYGLEEDVFRPIGLTNHPLTLGMMCAAGIGFVAATNWRVATRIAAVFVLFVGAAASGARFATLIAAAEIICLLLLVPWTRLGPRQEKRAKLIVLIVVLAGGAALVGMLFAAGLMSRFGDSLFDENFMARIVIYDVFGHVGWRDVLFGADLGAILAIVNEKLDLPYIESTPVVLIFQLGLPLALGFAALVLWIFRRLLKGTPRPALFGVLAFFLAALSNNTLSTKTPTVAMVVVLLIAVAGAVPARSRLPPRGAPRG